MINRFLLFINMEAPKVLASKRLFFTSGILAVLFEPLFTLNLNYFKLSGRAESDIR